MAAFRTSGCERFGQKEIVLRLSDDAQMVPTWLLNYFTESCAAGKQFKAEETFQIGWMLTKLKENPEGDLELWEPRFGPVPIEWVSGINNTLRQLILQKSVSALFHQEPHFPSITHAGSVADSFSSRSGEFYMRRVSPVASDSGWQFSARKESAPTFKLHSLFEIASLRPSIIPFLALPTGAHVESTRTETAVEWNGIQISSNENELLRRLCFAES